MRVAAGRVLDQHPDWVNKAYDLTADAIKRVQDDSVPVSELEDFIVGQIPWARLTFEERDITRQLISMVRLELEEHFRQRGIENPEAVKVAALRVLSWVNQSAEIRR